MTTDNDSDISIRREEPKDHQAVFELIEKAFEKEEMSDHKEQFLVERLRGSTAFVPELSLVAVDSNQQTIVGHILLTKIQIISSSDGKHKYGSLALAPVAVLPGQQGKGIGGKLVRRAHEVAKSLGHTSVILLGHPTYYPRFGYKPCDEFGISLPFEGIPRVACMAIELMPDALKDVEGVVRYPKEFEG